MTACALEIVEHAQQLADHRGLSPLGGSLLVAQRPLAVVGEVGLHPLQIAEQFGRLIGLLRSFGLRRPRVPPRGGGTGSNVAYLAGLGIDPPLVSDGYLFVRVAFGHWPSWSSSTTSASTTSSAPAWPGSPAPPAACSDWVAS